MASSTRVRVEYRDDHGIESREFPLEGLGDSAEFLSLLRRFNRVMHR